MKNNVYSKLDIEYLLFLGIYIASCRLKRVKLRRLGKHNLTGMRKLRDIFYLGNTLIAVRIDFNLSVDIYFSVNK